MPQAVKFSEYGGPEVLRLVDIERPVAGSGEVVVEVVAAGINPGESAVRSGRVHEQAPARFPEGQGSDFAGIIIDIGPGVIGWSVNDAVIGHTRRGSHATHIAVSADQIIPKPHGLSWEVAGGLYLAAATASAVVDAVGVDSGDTVLITAAAGGVGNIATQLCLAKGAKVIGTASPRNFDYLRQLGAIPVTHGEALAERIREIAPTGVDAVIALSPLEGRALAAELGVADHRAVSIIGGNAVNEYGEPGIADTVGLEAVARIATLVENHRMTVPISGIYPLSDVAAAFAELELGHARGKIVIGMHPVQTEHDYRRGGSRRESAMTVDVPTDHERMNVHEKLPPVVGHARGRTQNET